MIKSKQKIIYIKNIFLIAYSALLAGCTMVANNQLQQSQTYIVQHTETSPNIDANWDKDIWHSVPNLAVTNIMGKQPHFIPDVRVKMLYDDKFLYIIWRVEEKYAISRARSYGDKVWEDSAVEFFFSPDKNISIGYFNFETNCGGTSVFRFQRAKDKDVRYFSLEDANKIVVAHTMPTLTQTEIKEVTTWTIEIAIPFSLLEKYCKIKKPDKGGTWRANFYKCAEANSNPHWMTWSFIKSDRPIFHVPQYFGKLQFE